MHHTIAIYDDNDAPDWTKNFLPDIWCERLSIDSYNECLAAQIRKYNFTIGWGRKDQTDHVRILNFATKQDKDRFIDDIIVQYYRKQNYSPV